MPSEQRIRELARGISDVCCSPGGMTNLIEDAIRAALAEQREEDAKICENPTLWNDASFARDSQKCAAAIRAQGAK